MHFRAPLKHWAAVSHPSDRMFRGYLKTSRADLHIKEIGQFSIRRKATVDLDKFDHLRSMFLPIASEFELLVLTGPRASMDSEVTSCCV